jgi:hypothetical protein
VSDAAKEKKSEVECSKCNREFKHKMIERFLEEEKEEKLLDYFKGLWNPPKEGKFVCKCSIYSFFISCCVFFVFYFILFYFFVVYV